jgi:hypothetical protein
MLPLKFGAGGTWSRGCPEVDAEGLAAVLPEGEEDWAAGVLLHAASSTVARTPTARARRL